MLPHPTFDRMIVHDTNTVAWRAVHRGIDVGSEYKPAQWAQLSHCIGHSPVTAAMAAVWLNVDIRPTGRTGDIATRFRTKAALGVNRKPVLSQ